MAVKNASLILGLLLGLSGVGCQCGGCGYPGDARTIQGQMTPGSYQVAKHGMPQGNYQTQLNPDGTTSMIAGPGSEPPGHLPLDQPLPNHPLPHEGEMTYHPTYIIEAPDVLLLDAVRLVPRPPYRIEPLDTLLIQVGNTPKDEPINGQVTVAPEGTINLGFNYGVVRVVGLTLEEAAVVVRNTLVNGRKLNNPEVSVSLSQFRGIAQTRGDYLVQQDGTITLGSYGSVCVQGLTICQAKARIEMFLSQFFLNPEISLTIAAFNSKYYYVITDGAGYGQQIYRFSITGKETVLDAITNVNGIAPVGSTKKIWLARPTPARSGCYQILPVNWQVIVQAGDTETNWQVLPGDRIFIQSDPLIWMDNILAKALAPLERILGVTLLGTSIYQTLAISNQRNGTNGALVTGGF